MQSATCSGVDGLVINKCRFAVNDNKLETSFSNLDTGSTTNNLSQSIEDLKCLTFIHYKPRIAAAILDL